MLGKKTWNFGIKYPDSYVSPRKGIVPKSAFKKGHAAWNKGKTNPKINGDKHPMWKGESVGYAGVHIWITKHFGQPLSCEVCGLNDKNRKYHWANLSHKYLRKRSDYKRMCVPCHRKHDNWLEKMLATRSKNYAAKRVRS